MKAILEVGTKVDDGFAEMRQSFADVRGQLAALQQQLVDVTKLINQRACETTTQVAAVHHTVNHVQRMMLVPEGQRPGGWRLR